MRYRVTLLDDAEKDIEDIYRAIAQRDSVQSADRILEGLEQRWARLTDMPERGNLPRELLNLGVTECRETHYKPYRIIY
jgi:toxin ParE1/3/4